MTTYDGESLSRGCRSLAQSQAEVEALERRLAEAQDAEGRALADLRDAEQALADRCGKLVDFMTRVTSDTIVIWRSSAGSFAKNWWGPVGNSKSKGIHVLRTHGLCSACSMCQAGSSVAINAVRRR